MLLEQRPEEELRGPSQVIRGADLFLGSELLLEFG